MIPAGDFKGAPGLGGLGSAVRTLRMPQNVAAWPTPFDATQPDVPIVPSMTRPVGLLGLSGATAADSPLYAAVTLLGAGLGGALLGWVAADSKEGALKGGAFAAGMTGVSTGMATWHTQKALGAVLVTVGIGGMLWSVRDRIKRRR